MFPISWVIVEKEITKSWIWFIQHLHTDLCIKNSLGLSVVSNMQKVCSHFMKI